MVYIVDSNSSKHNNVHVEFGNSKLKQTKSAQINSPSM